MKFTAALADRLASLAGLSLAEGEAEIIAHELTRRRNRLSTLDGLDAHSTVIAALPYPGEEIPMLRPDAVLASSPREALFSPELVRGAVSVPCTME